MDLQRHSYTKSGVDMVKNITQRSPAACERRQVHEFLMFILQSILPSGGVVDVQAGGGRSGRLAHKAGADPAATTAVLPPPLRATCVFLCRCSSPSFVVPHQGDMIHLSFGTESSSLSPTRSSYDGQGPPRLRECLLEGRATRPPPAAASPEAHAVGCCCCCRLLHVPYAAAAVCRR